MAVEENPDRKKRKFKVNNKDTRTTSIASL